MTDTAINMGDELDRVLVSINSTRGKGDLKRRYLPRFGGQPEDGAVSFECPFGPKGVRRFKLYQDGRGYVVHFLGTKRRVHSI